MYKDIYNRPLHLGDLILYRLGMEDREGAYAVLIAENKIAYGSSYCSITETKKLTYCCLIENPNVEELQIKDSILKLYKKELDSKLKKKVDKNSLSTSYVPGDILFYQGTKYLYLGNISLIDARNKDYSMYNISGHAYLYISESKVPVLNENNIYNYLNNMIYLKESIYVMGKDISYGPASSLYQIEFTKTKSRKYESKEYHVDISYLNNLSFYVKRKKNSYDRFLSLFQNTNDEMEDYELIELKVHL